MKNSRDYIILGAGPAGLQMGYYMEKSHMNYLILEQANTVGSFLMTYPRHRTMISINKRYTGANDAELKLKFDWNSLLSDDPDMRFTRYSERYFPNADDYVRYLKDFAKKFHLNIQYNTQITRISKDEHGFKLHCKNKTYYCQKLIVATGMSKAVRPSFEGHELIEDYSTMSVDPQQFINQDILIIGKGNSAFETADNLIETAARIHIGGESSIKMAWKTHYVGHLRAVNNNFLDTSQLKSQNVILDGKIIRIKKVKQKLVVTFEFFRANNLRKDLIYDRVISCTGFRFDPSIFDASVPIKMTLKDRFPKQNNIFESVTVPHLYFAGTLMQMRDFKISTAAVIHGFRYTIRALHAILSKKYHGIDFPETVFPISKLSQFIPFITHRVTTTSSLWQQYAFLGDVVFIENKKLHHIADLPIDYIQETLVPERTQRYFLITLEYGTVQPRDPFDIGDTGYPKNKTKIAYNFRYLHPIIRYYQGKKLIATHEIPGNIYSKWDDPKTHQIPLRAFFKNALTEE